MTYRRLIILTFLPIAVKLAIWAMIRKTARRSLNTNEKVICVREMHQQGYSNIEIAESLGLNEPMVRALHA